MCNNTCKAQEAEPKLSLEVGKTYLDGCGKKVEILCSTKAMFGVFIGERVDGTTLSSYDSSGLLLNSRFNELLDLVKEYNPKKELAESLPVDTKVWVWSSEADNWLPAHFRCWTGTLFFLFSKGTSSHTSPSGPGDCALTIKLEDGTIITADDLK